MTTNKFVIVVTKNGFILSPENFGQRLDYQNLMPENQMVFITPKSLGEYIASNFKSLDKQCAELQKQSTKKGNTNDR